MFGFRPEELIIVLAIALLFFGPKKLPEIGSAIGKSITSFKKGMHADSEATSTPKEELLQLTSAQAADKSGLEDLLHKKG